MNERIEKLAEQAMVNAVSKNFTGEKLELRMPSEAWAKEFAELIIKECIKEIGYKSVELLDVDLFPHYQLRLKNHFGIQE